MKCKQAVKSLSKKPPIPVDESSKETVDFTNSTDVGDKHNTSENPLNLLADAATHMLVSHKRVIPGGNDTVIKPKIAAECGSNKNNDIPTTDLRKEKSVDPHTSEKSVDPDKVKLGKERNHRINLEHWGHYNPRLRSNQFLAIDQSEK